MLKRPLAPEGLGRMPILARNRTDRRIKICTCNEAINSNRSGILAYVSIAPLNLKSHLSTIYFSGPHLPGGVLLRDIKGLYSPIIKLGYEHLRDGTIVVPYGPSPCNVAICGKRRASEENRDDAERCWQNCSHNNPLSLTDELSDGRKR
jgi:hypothetical protein